MKSMDYKINPFSIILFRIMLSGIFIVAGINHLTQASNVVMRIKNARFGAIGSIFGDPVIAVYLSGIVMVVGALAFLFGFKTRWMAWILLLVLIPITLTIQVGSAKTMGPLFKNIAIAGGLVFFIFNDMQRKRVSV